MLDKEFDQYFRDRLLDHPSKVHLSIWRRVHTRLLQHKGFQFWKWYVAAPSAIIVAVTGHIILAALHPKAPTTPKATAVAAYDNRPMADSAAIAAATAATSAAATDSAGATDSAATVTSATAATPAAATDPAAAARSENSATTAAPAGAHYTRAHRTSSYSSALTNAHGHHRTGSHAAAETDDETPGTGTSNRTAAGTANKIAAHLLAPAKLVVLKTPPAVAAKTPNAKSSHQLTLPAGRPHGDNHYQLDVFGSPEHFTWNTIGLSYGAGARLTMVFKNHWTVSSGLQYQRINVNHVRQVDSISGLLPGYFANLQIPLLLGYTTGNDRFSLSVKAGPIWNLGTQAHGSLKNVDTWPNHSLNAYLGVSFSSRVTDRISLFAEPYVKCWFPPCDIKLPPQLWSTGLMLGVRINF